MEKDEGGASRDEDAVGGGMSEEEIDRNVMETFPASDPPSWTLGIGPEHPPRPGKKDEPPSR